MQVETYEVISVDEQNGDVVNEIVSEESLALIEQLGLKGQRELVAESKAEDGETVVTRNPYRRITAEELAIFSVILPNRQTLMRYSDGPIPLRVLQIAAHAKEHFDQLQVWCPEPGQRDPLLMGQKGGFGYSDDHPRGGGELFILARWGEILEPLETLRAKAAEKLIVAVRVKIADAKALLAGFESSFEQRIASHLRGGMESGMHVSVDFSR